MPDRLGDCDGIRNGNDGSRRRAVGPPAPTKFLGIETRFPGSCAAGPDDLIARQVGLVRHTIALCRDAGGQDPLPATGLARPRAARPPGCLPA